MTVSVWLSDDAAQRKARQVIEQAYTVRISVPRRDLDEVRRAAIDAYNARKTAEESEAWARGVPLRDVVAEAMRGDIDVKGPDGTVLTFRYQQRDGNA